MGSYKWLLLYTTIFEMLYTFVNFLGGPTQLFHSLLVQSTLPLILIYFPTGIVFIFPMLNIELNINFGFIGFTIAIYPAIDPFPTIIIIKKYRERCREILRKSFWKVTKASEVLRDSEGTWDSGRFSRIMRNGPVDCVLTTTIFENANGHEDVIPILLSTPKWRNSETMS
ncbi:unnamed protein product [Caenorhabditis nigoni]